MILYYISRNIPLSIKSIKDIVFNENENLDCLLDGIETDNGYEAVIIGEVNMFVRFHHFNYEDNHFNTVSWLFS